MTWFETLTGCREESPEQVRSQLSLEGSRLCCNFTGREWLCGELITPTLAELRDSASRTAANTDLAAVNEVVADIQELHQDVANAGAMFQVASQFNLLEMTSPNAVPEYGIGIYENDFTQGPACAIAAGAGTIYRNYFVPLNGNLGQRANNQIDCLLDIGKRLGNSKQQLWKMVNGYALPTKRGLELINKRLGTLDESQRDELRGLLRIGLQLDTQVTLGASTHVVSQAYCSAMPVAYTAHTSDLWAPFATLILEAAYEATICASILNAARTGNNRLYLTLLGGGAFGNEMAWIQSAIMRAISLYPDCGLNIAIVSYRHSNPAVRQLTQTLNAQIRDR